MSDTKSAQEQTTTEVSMMKTSLRTHFARLLDDELDVDEVTNWFASLAANEVKALKKQGVKIIVNPEWHKPDHDHPDGRSKMRWLVLGYMQVGDNTNIDAPTLVDSTVKMMVAMGTPEGQDPMDDELATGDIKNRSQSTYGNPNSRKFFEVLVCANSLESETFEIF